ncbi:PHD finger-like domain-containing protein 5A isoform X1 [Arvicanthis niloticus]|uniref:PHD finger-like domain-containing protein 5A isoform X1 n=1 Tax=Arvicanthis niloticus TaxID=61156 RepID=UPI00402BD3D3
MAKHHPDLIFCRKQAGVAIGRLCEKCDGKCVICDSYVRPCTLVRICDECNYGSYQGRCVICGGPGVSDAYYCKECTIQEKDMIMQMQCPGFFLCRNHPMAEAILLIVHLFCSFDNL